jgi:predicted MPP superfamily phosphohydrolase
MKRRTRKQSGTEATHPRAEDPKSDPPPTSGVSASGAERQKPQHTKRPRKSGDGEQPPRKNGRGKFHRARIRHFFFTHGPHRLTGGRLTRRHIAADIHLREIEVVCPTLPRAFDGLRVGHVSDFHLGHLLPLERALEIVRMLEAEEPDIVACTGDVIDLHSEGAEPLFEALANMGAPLGSLFVMGNHDELEDGECVARMATSAGLMLLRNEAVEINHNGAELIVAGVEWGKTLAQCRRHVDAACDESVHLLLSHNPKSFRRAAEIGIPLTLAGHTHGGQIAMRKRPHESRPARRKHKAGLFHHHHSRLFVTTGVGAWFPLRINVPPEIAVITLRSGGE